MFSCLGADEGAGLIKCISFSLLSFAAKHPLLPSATGQPSPLPTGTQLGIAGNLPQCSVQHTVPPWEAPIYKKCCFIKGKWQRKWYAFLVLWLHASFLLFWQAVGRSGLPGSSVEPHLDVPQHLQVAKHLTPSGASEEPSDLEELEKFAKTFKQRRIKLGFTQVSSLVNGKGGVACDVDMWGWGSLWQRSGWRKGRIRYSLAFFGASPSKYMKRETLPNTSLPWPHYLHLLQHTKAQGCGADSHGKRSHFLWKASHGN